MVVYRGLDTRPQEDDIRFLISPTCASDEAAKGWCRKGLRDVLILPTRRGVWAVRGMPPISGDPVWRV